VLPNCDSDSAISIAKNINRAITTLWGKNELDHTQTFINMGLYRYKPNVSIGDLLTRADNALSEAKAKDEENICLFEEKDSENALGKDQWREIIEESIDKNFFSLRFWPTLNAKTKKLDHKVMTFTIDGGVDKKYFYGDFIAPAINLGLVSKMYIVALKDLIVRRHEELDGSTCSIRLSNEFIKDKRAFDKLSALFETYAKNLKFKLSFEVSDSFAINNTVAVKEYVNLFSKYDFSFGINSFTGESSDFAYLKELNPEFLKSDCAFLLDQSQDSMSALQVITDSLGIEIIATFVKNKEELARLLEMHISSVQGPVTDVMS
jgi:EAL domain-containing protein (putative c-di-GMP-specific phosphodiesterase class I)